ncbi:hypothetical protein Gotri_005581, partial [Gossypium trilobum]|nr:hypothetical protein [Gossypium trilobum]
MGRSPCCSKEGLNRGAWTALEDKILTDYIKVHGEGRWRNLPKRAGLKRCGKSCRLRWLNYLRPDIKRGNISADEEELIIKLHKLLGNSGSSSTHVVRTRATRCSKVFINPHHHTQNRDPKPSSTCSNHGDHGESKTMNELLLPIMSESENEGTTDHISSDFTFDFNMGEFCLSDLLNSDFCDVSELNYSKGFDSSPSPDQPPLDFSDEMLKEWTAAASTHCSHQS